MQILVGDCVEFNHQRKKRDADCATSTEVSGNVSEDNRDDLARRNSGYNRRRGYRNRASSSIMKEQGSKPNDATTNGPSTTVSLNEIADGHDKLNKQRGSLNKTSTNSELERESDESYEGNVTTEEPTSAPGYDGLPIIFPGDKQK